MTTKIDSTTVADPDLPFEESVREYATSRRTLTGTRVKHTRATKRVWNVRWTLLTPAEFVTLTTQLNKTTNLTWKPPTGGSYTVHVVEGSRFYEYDEYGTCTVQVALEEV